MSAAAATERNTAYSYIAAFLESVMGLSGTHVALAQFGFGLAGIGGNWLAPRFVDRDPTALTLIVTLIIIIATAGVSLAASHWPTVLLLLGFWGAAHMAAFVACQVRVMFAGLDAPAFAGSLNISVCNLGVAAGAIFGGWVVSRFGVAVIGLPSAAIGIAALFVAWRLSRQRNSLNALSSRSKGAHCVSP